MTFRDDCKIEVSAYGLSPQVWCVEVSILRVNNGKTLLARATVRESTDMYRSAVNALEAARAYVGTMIVSDGFDCSPVPN